MTDELKRARDALKMALDAWTGDGPSVLLDDLRSAIAAIDAAMQGDK